MGKFIFVTGGARSGKSTFAEETVKTFGEHVIYVATSIPFDDDMKDRIRKHREQRPHYWETIEAYKDLDKHLVGRLNGKSAVLLDCVTIMVTNLMFEEEVDWDTVQPEEVNAIEKRIGIQIEKLIRIIKTSPVPFVLVTNEVGLGVVPAYPWPRFFRDIAGRMNQLLAKAADEAYFCVSGIPMKIKG